MSLIGLISPSSWIISSFSKALTTWNIPSTAYICDKNAFPKPAPSLAPLTNPAMSVIDK